MFLCTAVTQQCCARALVLSVVCSPGWFAASLCCLHGAAALLHRQSRMLCYVPCVQTPSCFKHAVPLPLLACVLRPAYCIAVGQFTNAEDAKRARDLAVLAVHGAERMATVNPLDSYT